MSVPLDQARQEIKRESKIVTFSDHDERSAEWPVKHPSLPSGSINERFPKRPCKITIKSFSA
jgi:hypothetical protein